MVKSDTHSQKLWFALDSEFADLVSGRSDAAIAALLIPAMERDEDIFIAGTVSERLYHSLQHRHQTLLQTLLPSLSIVDISAENVEPAEGQASGVATGFSGGVDSFATLADYYLGNQQEGFELTHLLFNNVGSHGSRGEMLFDERYELVRPVADRLGLPFVQVNTNIDAFYNETTFQETHTQRNTAIALLLQKGIGRFLYASGFSYKDVRLNGTYDMAYSDPVVLPHLSTGGLDNLSVGGEYTRVEKTLRVADIEESHRFLNVCANGHTAGNCSNCSKCRRTLLTLEIAGLLDRYNKVFDLETYRRGRKLYMSKVLSSDSPLLQEIVSFAEASEFDFPPTAKALSKVYNPLSSTTSRLNKYWTALQQSLTI